MRSQDEPGDEKAVVVASKNDTRLYIKKHKKALAAEVIVLIVVVALLFWFLKPKPGNVSSTNYINQSSLQSVQSNANQLAQQNGINAGLQVYVAAINDTNPTDNLTRADLDLGAANLLVQYNTKTSTALSYAISADNYLKSSETSALVASLYQQTGNNSKAVSYYQKAANEVPAHPLTGYNKSYYLAQAQSLEGSN